jgi:hypothetical protein
MLVMPLGLLDEITVEARDPDLRENILVPDHVED